MHMKYLDHVTDLGIVLSPDAPGGSMYAWDGGGMREAVLMEENGWHYLSYDGAMPGAANHSYWNACLARSRDYLHWEKLGPRLCTSALKFPDGTPETHKDLRSASSPWSFFDGKKWHFYYVGADHCSPEGIPAFAYSTMYAWADSLEGEWHQRSHEPGKGTHLCLPLGKPGEWDDVTASPGEVIENPQYDPNDPESRRYLMVYSGSCSGVTKRSLGLAYTDDLTATGAHDDPNGTFWEKLPEPILPVEDDIENSSLFYEESSGLWWLFTNHVHENLYTNSVWVYWSKDLRHWDPADKAVVVDASVSTWAKGAIGMPSVKRLDDDHLILLYDGVKGGGIGHLERHIGAAVITLPLTVSESMHPYVTNGSMRPGTDS